MSDSETQGPSTALAALRFGRDDSAFLFLIASYQFLDHFTRWPMTVKLRLSVGLPL